MVLIGVFVVVVVVAIMFGVVLIKFVFKHVLVIMLLFILAGADFGLVNFVVVTDDGNNDNGTDDDDADDDNNNDDGVTGSTTVVTRNLDVEVDMGAGKLVVGEQLIDGGGVIGDVLVSTTRDT